MEINSISPSQKETNFSNLMNNATAKSETTKTKFITKLNTYINDF